MSDLVKRYTSSVFFDKRLWEADIAGSLAHAADAGAPRASSSAKTTPPSSAAWRRSPRDRVRQVRVEAGPGRRAPQHRSPPDRSWWATPASACTPAARRNDQVATDVRLWLRGEIDLIGDLLAALQSALRGRGRQACRRHPAGLHPPAGGAAGELWPPPAGLCGDVRRATPSAWPTCARRINRLPLGAAALAGTSYPLDRERVAAHAAWSMHRAMPQSAKTAWTRSATATSPSSSLPLRRWPWCTSAALCRRADRVDEPELRLHRPGRPLLHRLLDHAAEEKPRRARAGTRQDRPRGRPPDGPCSR